MTKLFGLAQQISDPAFIQKISIPTEGYEPPLDEVINVFNSLELPKRLKPQTDIEAKVLAYECVMPWHIKLHCLYRATVDSAHKIPAKRNAARYYKYHATVLDKLKELCKEVHFRLGAQETGYPGAAEWFGLVIADQIHLDASLALRKARAGERARYQDIWADCQNAQPGLLVGKKGSTQIRRKYWLKKIKENESPFKLEADTFCPHWRKLIEKSIELADPNIFAMDRENKRNVFRNKYWVPYLKAEQAQIKAWEEDKEVAATWAENGKYFAQNGRGKGRKKIA